MSRRWKLSATVTVALVGALASAAATIAGGERTQAEEVVIGATIPKTGPLAAFGPSMEGGYKQVVDEYNAKGGLTIDGAKKKIKLVLLDNKSDPNLAATQARTLILQDKAIALLGAPTPPLDVPASNVAEQLKKPKVGAALPNRAWLAGRPSGWKWSWNIFFDEIEMTQTQYQATNLIKTNKKVVLFTDTEPDGVVMGGLWQKWAPKYGYKVVVHAKFPVGTTDFASFINQAKSAGAEVLIAQMIPPDAIALWKQMKALGYVPKAAFCEKCSNLSAWPQALGKVAVGTLNNDAGWSPDKSHPRSDEFMRKWAKKVGAPEVAFVVECFSAGAVLFDAINRAGSTDAAKINAEIAKTDKVYPVARVKFAKDHTSTLHNTQQQWVGDHKVTVWPPSKAKAKIITPPPGLAG